MLASQQVIALPFNDDMVHNQFKTGDFMRSLPNGSVPLGGLERHIPDRDFARTLENPLKGDATAELLGERLFRAHCLVCHGIYTPARQYQTPKVLPPMVGVDLSLALSEPNAAGEMRPKPDGHYFGYVYLGGLALMPRYGWKFSFEEIWQIVSFVQKMQKQRAAE
jgi:mono/diheme cytochrome c family protein